MKVKKLGNIVLSNNLWWTNYNDVTTIQVETETTVTGGVVVWEQVGDITSQEITLDSLGDGWQTIAVKDAIKVLVTGSFGLTTTITLDDDTVINVRFRHEQEGGSIDFSRLIDTSLSEYYTCRIYLGRV